MDTADALSMHEDYVAQAAAAARAFEERQRTAAAKQDEGEEEEMSVEEYKRLKAEYKRKKAERKARKMQKKAPEEEQECENDISGDEKEAGPSEAVLEEAPKEAVSEEAPKEAVSDEAPKVTVSEEAPKKVGAVEEADEKSESAEEPGETGRTLNYQPPPQPDSELTARPVNLWKEKAPDERHEARIDTFNVDKGKVTGTLLDANLGLDDTGGFGLGANAWDRQIRPGAKPVAKASKEPTEAMLAKAKEDMMDALFEQRKAERTAEVDAEEEKRAKKRAKKKKAGQEQFSPRISSKWHLFL